MKFFVLRFQEDSLEKEYQKDLTFAKILNFHHFLVLEFLMTTIMLLFTLIYKEITVGRLLLLFSSIFIIFLIIYLAKKLKFWKYLVHCEVFIHIIFVVAILEYLISVYTGNSDLNTVLQIYGTPLQLLFISLFLTRINWIWCCLFDSIFHIYYVFRIYTIETMQKFPNIFCLHFICFTTFFLMAFYQEKTTRIFYKSIHESNKKIIHFQNLLKNVIPAPIFIVDFANKKINFLNDSAVEFINKFADKYSSSLEIFKLEKEKEMFNQFEQVMKILKFANSQIIDSESANDNNSINVYNNLLNHFNKKNTFIYNNVKDSEKFNFENLELYIEELENKSSNDLRVLKKYYNLLFLKMIWQNEKSLLIILHDITNIHRLEELKHLDDYKNRLLATVSHDLRTPVNGMMGMMELVLPKLKEKKDRKNLNVAIRSGHLLLNMINDILDFSQINNKKLRLNLENINLTEILKETIKIVKYGIKLKGLNFYSEFPKNDNCKIISDPIRIRQIVLNLLTNALKFTKKGHIKLKLESKYDGNNKYYKIIIEDTGIGIDKEDISKLFKLFGKIDKENVNELNKTGVGLGLTISKGLAMLLNNNDSEGIYLESSLEKGSTFWFYLPSIYHGEETIDSLIIPEENKEIIHLNKFEKKGKVLLVDDDLVNIMIEKKYCDYYGIEYDSVNDGIEAVQYIQNKVIVENRYINGIIMDCNMPIMDGITASKEIYKILTQLCKKEIPIIIISAGIVKNITKELKDCSIKSLLIKPVSRKIFGDTIAKYLNITIN